MHLPKLLIVEDDSSIARALALALRTTYVVELVASGEQALQYADNQLYSAIILDLNLPGISGLVVCQQLRQQGIILPILVLSGESQVLTKIMLLDAGANDYLSKPFSLGELKARLRVLIRSAGQIMLPARQIIVNGLCLDRQTHTVQRAGQTISLRRKEFALLECLMEHAGSVVTRSTLTRYAWTGLEDPWTNTVDVHIKYLRDKIDRPFEEQLIQTVHGLGYRLKLSRSLSGEGQ